MTMAKAGKYNGYLLEGGVREILDARFEVPLPSEVDVWIMG